MECDYNSHNPSLKDASSLSQLVDSVVAEVQQSLLSEAITDEDELTIGQPVEELQNVPKIRVVDELDHLRTNEEEELSEYWDQVLNQYTLLLCRNGC